MVVNVTLSKNNGDEIIGSNKTIIVLLIIAICLLVFSGIGSASLNDVGEDNSKEPISETSEEISVVEEVGEEEIPEKSTVKNPEEDPVFEEVEEKETPEKPTVFEEVGEEEPPEDPSVFEEVEEEETPEDSPVVEEEEDEEDTTCDDEGRVNTSDSSSSESLVEISESFDESNSCNQSDVTSNYSSIGSRSYTTTSSIKYDTNSDKEDSTFYSVDESSDSVETFETGSEITEHYEKESIVSDHSSNSTKKNPSSPGFGIPVCLIALGLFLSHKLRKD